jgi:L-ascorbate metabolism protein UlaG (beta-lactamase superfamily)
MRHPLRLIVTTALLSLALACAGKPPEKYLATGEVCVPHQGSRPVLPLRLDYLGSGGWILRHGRTAVATAPFYSNPGVLRLAFGQIRANREVIERWLPDFSDVSAILLGHAHYDHLMDLGIVAESAPSDSRIYANATAAHTLAAMNEDLRVTVVSDDAWSFGRPENWITVASVDGKPRARVLSIRSDHAPHFAGIRLMDGHLHSDLGAVPTRALKWIGGDTLAFLIEFLNDAEEVVYRVHYSDASSGPRAGQPPKSDLRIDVAIPCVASFHAVDDYPGWLVKQLDPRHFALGHWEDFFRPYTQDPAELRTVRATNVNRFIATLEAAEVPRDAFTLPAPGTRIVLSPAGCSTD